MNTQTQTTECQQWLFNGTLCRRPVVGTVALDFTTDRKPVCKRHTDASLKVNEVKS